MRFLHPFFVLFFAVSSFIAIQSEAQDLFNSIEKEFNAYKDSAPKERIHIITDRNVYAPGELIWINATVFDIHSSRISDLSSELTIEIVDNESMRLFKKTLVLDKGSAAGFVKIPKMMKEGIYYLKGTTKLSDPGNYNFTKIIIMEKILPQFLIRASFPDKEFIPGDQFNLTLEFIDFYNEPKRNVEYTIDFYDGKKRIPGSIGKAGKTGNAIIDVKIPLKLKSGIFSYKVTADCRKLQTTLFGKIPVLTDKIFIDFYPENGKLIDALESKVSIFSYDVSGSSLAIEADLMEDGKPVQAFTTDSNGLGTFKMVPDIEKTYHVKIKRPLLLDKEYEFLPISAKGIALREKEKNSKKVTYLIENGYQSTRSVYLVGVSEGEIFWTSEHEIDRRLEVDIDLSKANGRWAHFIAINAAERIEGEHILMIPSRGNESIELDPVETSTLIRGENLYEVDLKSNQKGKTVVSVVNSLWIIDELNNQNLRSVALPVDLSQEIVFMSKEFNGINYSDEDLEKYNNYYLPYAFGWDRILNTNGAYFHKPVNSEVLKSSALTEKIIVRGNTVRADGKITQINLISEKYLAASNPKYILSLYESKKEKKPGYKSLLESGTPILDVLQTIKPYNLQGNNIVFLGGANSLNFQGGALIAIDGVNRGTDASILSSLSPFDVETIYASTNPNDIQRYTGLNSVGLVEITLKSGKEVLEQEEEITEETQFTSPVYRNEQDLQGNDFRSTLWWEIINVGANQQNVSFKYYNSELISNVKGIVYFIPEKGAPTMKSFDYKIK